MSRCQKVGALLCAVFINRAARPVLLCAVRVFVWYLQSGIVREHTLPKPRRNMDLAVLRAILRPSALTT